MNIGILGTGSIARTMAAEFAKVPAFRCEAVCSRQQATGEALAQQFGIPKVYTDYDAMLADPDIELVYIATPNSLHYAQTKAALLAGKNVLCEKPFVPTVAEADELIALAKEKHLFLFEAIRLHGRRSCRRGAGTAPVPAWRYASPPSCPQS